MATTKLSDAQLSLLAHLAEYRDLAAFGDQRAHTSTATTYGTLRSLQRRGLVCVGPRPGWNTTGHILTEAGRVGLETGHAPTTAAR